MFHSFKFKFIASFVILQIFFLLMISIINIKNYNTSYEHFIDYKKQSLSSLVKELLITPVSVYDISNIDTITQKVTQLKDVYKMKVWDSENNLITEITNDLMGNAELIKIESNLEVGNTNVGKFTIWLNLNNYTQTIELNKQQNLIIILIEIIISTILSWVIGHRISENLTLLKEYAENLYNNIDKRIPFLRGEKEIEVLSSTLENVREQLSIDQFELKHYSEIIDENVIISRTNLQGKILYTSKAFCEISGYKESELLNKNHNIVRHPDMPKELYENMWSTIKQDLIWSGEIKNKKKDGTHYWVETTIYPWLSHEGEKIGYIGVRQDITYRKKIEEISITDGLTGIYNRRHFNDIFPKVINSAKRDNELVSFLIMDIDHFKQYNDTYGHQMGDKVLIKVANTIKSSTKRADDYCFRLGGEEFGIIFKADSIEKSKEFAQNIRQNIENLHIKHSGNSASSYVTASMGLICQNACDIYDDEEIYKFADDLLYKAKENGRNKVVYEEAIV